MAANGGVDYGFHLWSDFPSGVPELSPNAMGMSRVWSDSACRDCLCFQKRSPGQTCAVVFAFVWGEVDGGNLVGHVHVAVPANSSLSALFVVNKTWMLIGFRGPI